MKPALCKPAPRLRRFASLVGAVVLSFAMQPWYALAQSAAADAAYHKPEGWSETVQGDARMLVAPVARDGQLLAVLISSWPADGSATKQIQSLADAAEASAKRLSRGAVQTDQRGSLKVLTMPASVDQPGLGVHDRIYELVTDGRRTVFLVVLTRGKETLQAQRTALAQLMQGITPGAMADAPAPVAAAAGAPVDGSGIPYGGKPVNVLDKEFRPSGHGKAFPAPSIVKGAPVGPWWYLSTSAYGSSARVEIFFPDGTAAFLLRPGLPWAADLDGMHALGDDDFIGRFQVKGSMATAQWGSDPNRAITRPIVLHERGEASSFLWYQREYQPALPVTPKFLVGVWRLGAMGTYTFRADGTVVTTATMIEADGVGSKGDTQLQGRWFADGYLLAMRFGSAGDRVYSAFRTSHGELVLRQSILTRQ